MSRFVDLTQSVGHGTVTYPTLPPLSISDELSREASKATYAPGVTFQIARIDMVANTGTYLDAPSHRYEDGADLASLPLELTVDLDGLLIDATATGRVIEPEAFAGAAVAGRAVLFHTGWSRHFATPAYGARDRHPFVTRAAAEALVSMGARLVGIDSVNIDNMDDFTRPVHSLLLQAGIPIVEHLTALDRLPPQGFRFFAAPPKFRGVGTFPVRAFAIVD
ncbi:MAG TPA: cyclase family protein [Thermoanaerobaculia bacterium]|nr:cyclase family protein [Thermoanaerobaculia bacterium]